jgi:hypothetical protein
MTVEPYCYEHRDYKILITHTPPFFQAAICPQKPDLPEVDWQSDLNTAIHLQVC